MCSSYFRFGSKKEAGDESVWCLGRQLTSFTWLVSFLVTLSGFAVSDPPSLSFPVHPGEGQPRGGSESLGEMVHGSCWVQKKKLQPWVPGQESQTQIPPEAGQIGAPCGGCLDVLGELEKWSSYEKGPGRNVVHS